MVPFLLSERKQFVMIQGNRSSTAPLDFGVTQGSVLDPVLFMYTTPLSLIIEKHSVNHEMLADDTQFCKSAPQTDYDSMVLSLQKCTADINVIQDLMSSIHFCIQRKRSGI